MTFSHSVVRRSLEAAGHALSNSDKPGHGDDGDDVQVNPIALLVIALTFIVFAVLLFTVC